jgi:transcriptional regulator with XRE-family HTH domain
MENNFSTWLDKKLNQKGWTRAELARKAKISDSTLSMIYSGKRGLGIKTSKAIADALDISVNEVLYSVGHDNDVPTPRDLFEQMIVDRLPYLSDDQLSQLFQYIDFIQYQESKPIKIKT